MTRDSRAATPRGGLALPYQREWLADDSRFKIGMMARQTGKTWTCTLEIVLDCLQAAARGKSARWVILSRGERQAREAMEEGVKRHLSALQTAFKEREIDFAGDESRALEVKLPGGSRISALPANAETARGYAANVLLDEFAHHADSRKIWTALFPVISAGHKLRVVSTPNGKGNKFYELMTDCGKTGAVWSRHVVDIYRAAREGLPRDIELLRAGLADGDAWAQEYELQWLDEASAWLPYELIAAAEHGEAGDAGRYGGGPAYIGMDIGRRNDLTVIWVWERVGDVLWTREARALRRASFAEQAAALDELVGRYRPLRVAMDRTGMGEAPVEEAQRRHGALRVEGVTFTAAAKQHMATLAKQALEERRLRIPAGDAALRAELHSLRRVITPAGNVRFDAGGANAAAQAVKTDGHADRAWAAFLGIYAAATQGEEFAFRRVPRGGGRVAGHERRLADERPRRRVRATGGFRRGLL